MHLVLIPGDGERYGTQIGTRGLHVAHSNHIVISTLAGISRENGLPNLLRNFSSELSQKSPGCDSLCSNTIVKMAELHTGTLGWVYIALTSAWTVILLGAMAFLYHHRQLPFIRIRRLPLVFTAIVLLHMYEAAAMAAWTYGPLMPCDVQFWIMSIYLPFGMAMLQASNSQFLHVAAKQRQYTKYHGPNGQKFPNKVKEADPSWSWWKKLIWSARNADKVTQILILIGIAMVVEVRQKWNPDIHGSSDLD